jgi:hypothetical protein
MILTIYAQSTQFRCPALLLHHPTPSLLAAFYSEITMTDSTILIRYPGFFAIGIKVEMRH